MGSWIYITSLTIDRHGLYIDVDINPIEYTFKTNKEKLIEKLKEFKV